MDKGTSESSLLGAGSPLPSIPLHSIVSYCTVPYQTRESIERIREFYILHFYIDRDPHSFLDSRHYGLIVPT
jgi:hypothetical protein